MNSEVKMALLRYLRPIDGLPDPKGPPSFKLPSAAIANANHHVQEAIHNGKQKRGSYNSYSPIMRSDTGKYACQHGVASAAQVFSKRLEKRVIETTVCSIRDSYKKELRKKRSAEDSEVSVVPPKKCGRRFYSARS